MLEPIPTGTDEPIKDPKGEKKVSRQLRETRLFIFPKGVGLMFTSLSQIIYTSAVGFASPEFVSIQSMINCT